MSLRDLVAQYVAPPPPPPTPDPIPAPVAAALPSVPEPVVSAPVPSLVVLLKDADEEHVEARLLIVPETRQAEIYHEGVRYHAARQAGDRWIYRRHS